MTVQTFTTSTVLLRLLRDSNDDRTWGPFVERYRPLLEAFARRVGVGREDARDIAQTALAGFVESYRAGGYEPEKGRLRDWLFGIARHSVSRWRRRRQVACVSIDVDESAMVEEQRRSWESDWMTETLRSALRQVRQEVDEATFELFDRVALRGEPVEYVARERRVSANAIYCAKRRILARLREISETIESEW